MLDMAQRDIIPAIIRQQAMLCDSIRNKQIVLKDAPPEMATLEQSEKCLSMLYAAMNRLENALNEAEMPESSLAKAKAYAASVLPAMHALRAAADSLEMLSSRDLWPLPGYSDILSSI